jgi:hypothetical protein
MDYTRSIGQNMPSILSAAEKEQLRASATFQEAYQRCRRPRFITSGQVDSKNYHRLYFCVEFGQDPKAPPESFLAAPHSFAEIVINLTNFRTNQPASCADFVNQGIHGAQVFYSLYWVSRSNSGYTYKRRNDYFYTSR